MTNPAHPFEFRLSREALDLKRSMMRDLIAVTARPGIISFAGGLPAPQLFPTEAWSACTQEVLAEDGARALQYGPPFMPLLESIAGIMSSRGAEVSPERILITTGAQQGLHVTSRLLMDPTSTAIVDRYVFTGVRQAFGGPDRVLREVDASLDTGLRLASLDEALEAAPDARAVVVVPDFHNPMGTSLNDASRQGLLSRAAGAGVPIVEDDPYALLAFDGHPSVPLVARSPERVLYLSSFSKIVAPALRLGWIVAPAELIPRLRVLKESVDLESSALMQRVLARFLEKGLLAPHLERVRSEYLVRRDAMVAALARHFPEGSRWSTPGGGMFLWVELPDGQDTLDLLPLAVEEGVAFVPGAAFASRPAPNAMRLNFSNAAPENIELGIARLGRVLASVRDSGASV